MARLLIALLVLCALPVAAQDSYPSRPVKLVAPFPAGGPLDVLARLVAQRLTEEWKNPVVVENVTVATGSPFRVRSSTSFRTTFVSPSNSMRAPPSDGCRRPGFSVALMAMIDESWRPRASPLRARVGGHRGRRA